MRFVDRDGSHVDAVSVLIRAYNSASTIERTLVSVRRQTVDAEIVIVDSGSDDATLELAARHADKVVAIPRGEFTYGRALNVGFDVASCEIVHPLSSHCAFEHDEHLAWVLELHSDERVIATNGIRYDDSGALLSRPIFLNRWPGEHRIGWGFSNHSASVRRSAWERVPFDERLQACEDKEWALRAYATDPSWTIAYDSRLMVSAAHRHTDGPARLYDRARREGFALQTILPATDISAALVLRQWVCSPPPDRRFPAPFYGLLPHRWLTALGVMRGAHAARRTLRH